LSETSANHPAHAVSGHINGCATCANLTRPTAYRWLGINKPIPALHSLHWLVGDLRRALDSLEPGCETELDYSREVEGAPRIALHRSVDDIISASGPTGWLRGPGQTTWNLPPSIEPDRDTWLVFMLLNFLKLQRGADGVVQVAPEDGETSSDLT
jgi:hypothetical protein